MFRELYVVRDPELIVEKLKGTGKGIYLNSGDEDEREGYTKFRKLGIPHKFYPYRKTFELLGTTWDFAVLDLTRQFVPNDIARVVETVRAGGKIVFITPEIEEWVNTKFKFHRVMVPLPFSLEDVEHNFMKRFVETLRRHENVYVQEGDELVGHSIESGTVKKFKPPKERPYSFCATEDQLKALKKLVSWFDSENQRFVLIADRGRGKSAVLGIFTAWLLKRKEVSRVIVTSPTESGIQVFFQFLHKTLDRLGIKHKVRKSGNFIFEVCGSKFFVRYHPPLDVGNRQRDLLIVDEASSIPTPELRRLNRGKVIFSTTVHGYEGHGRGFTLKFLRSLSDYTSFEMSEPIRYLPGDPIEKWLYDAFLLDVELDTPREQEYETIDRRKLINDEEKLRKYFSIYIWAHYKTDPNDIMISLDAPGKILRRFGDYGVLEASFEGGLSQDQIQALYESKDAVGNLIPDIMLKHYGVREFAEKKGARIVRIAVHPDYQGMGFGTKLVNSFVDEFSNLDWIGVSFGAEADLVRFWGNLGFKPVFLSPTKNSVSGEYSLIMVKPAKSTLEEVVSQLAESFARRFTGALPDTYRDMDPDTVREILVSLGIKKPLDLSSQDLHRLKRFLDGNLTYESIDDLAREVALAYFSLFHGLLKRKEEEVLIAKVLQCKTWDELVRELGRNDTYWILEVKDTLKKVISLIVK